MPSGTPSFALIIESRDPRGEGMPVSEGLAPLLERVGRHGALTEVVITHEAIPEAEQAELAKLVSAPVCFVQVPRRTSYYAAKNLGFEATTTDVVVFADADGLPEEGWLDRLRAPFLEGDAEIVTGRTAYPADVLGAAAAVLDLLQHGGFPLDNVAFRREVFETYRHTPGAPLYGGVPRTLARRLRAAGIGGRNLPQARVVRRSPGNLRELARCRLTRGEDLFAGLTALAGLALRLLIRLRTLRREGLSPLAGARYLGCVAWLLAMSAFKPGGAVVPGPQDGVPRGAIAISYYPGADPLGAGDTQAA